MDAKKAIKGIAKTTGKYAFKGIGKGVELAGRGSVRVIDSLVRDRNVQKIATSAGLLAASVMVPGIGVGLISTIGLKYMIDKVILEKSRKGMLDEINDIIEIGNIVTRNISYDILSPALNSMHRNIKRTGRNYQDKVDDMFK